MDRTKKLGCLLAAAAMALLLIACGDGAGGPGPTPLPPTTPPATIPPAPGALPGPPEGILVELEDHFGFSASAVFAENQTGNAQVIRAGKDYFSWWGIPSGPNHSGVVNAHNAVEGLLQASTRFDASGYTGIRFHHRSSHPWVFYVTDVTDGNFAQIFPGWSPPPASNEWRETTIHFANLVPGWGPGRAVDLSDIYQIGFQVNSELDFEGGIYWPEDEPLPIVRFGSAWMEVANFRFIDEELGAPVTVFCMAALVEEEGITAGTPLASISRLSPLGAETPTWVENPDGGLSLRVRGGFNMPMANISRVRIDFGELLDGDRIDVEVRGGPDFFLTPASEGMILLNQQNLPPTAWWNLVGAIWGATSGTIIATLNELTAELAYASVMANQGTGYFYVDSITITRIEQD